MYCSIISNTLYIYLCIYDSMNSTTRWATSSCLVCLRPALPQRRSGSIGWCVSSTGRLSELWPLWYITCIFNNNILPYTPASMHILVCIYIHVYLYTHSSLICIRLYTSLSSAYVYTPLPIHTPMHLYSGGKRDITDMMCKCFKYGNYMKAMELHSLYNNCQRQA